MIYSVLLGLSGSIAGLATLLAWTDEREHVRRVARRVLLVSVLVCLAIAVIRAARN
ncbi:hypothetical protein FB554_2776 [Barrientosiimonas humi]|uniref:Uncharacterized protein n=1 Tax=Barrientosiimonas humi TaxID=999931 RepID=A0A542XFK7_9MICO|nr:hypothetical protein [Barrientosiimonas humi]TQL34600.1 hypothetical protein FB554_2776 [Barrientosiimonas humi]CAG7574590.1 hypothetical protein BH39T_PBIAJDOK_03246 [Barrientosiimonas humi]